MIGGIISMILFALVDTYFIGQLGESELAAISFTFPVIMIVFNLTQGIGIGTTALVSRSIGNGNHKKAARETTDGLILALAIVGLFVILGLSTIDPVFRLMGATDEIMPLIREYMEIWYLAIVFVVTPFIGNSAIRSTGDTVTPSLIMIFAVAINAILDPLLIFGIGPFPRMEIQGAAVATAISRAFTLMLSFYILRYREKLITYKLPSWETLKGCWWAILKVGIPTAVSRMIVPLATFIVTAIIATHGIGAVAAFGVGSRVETVLMSVLIALSVVIAPFVGQNLGAGKADRIKQAFQLSMWFCLGWGVLQAIVLWFAGPWIAPVFNNDEEVIRLNVLYLALVPWGLGLQGITMVVNSMLNTIDRPGTAFFLTVGGMIVVFLPLAWLGSELYEVAGIFGSIAISYVVGGLASWLVIRKVLGKLTVAEA